MFWNQCNILNILNVTELYLLKMVSFMLCIFYHDFQGKEGAKEAGASLRGQWKPLGTLQEAGRMGT